MDPNRHRWSLLNVKFTNGDPDCTINLRASPSLLGHLLREAKETGWLYVFDDCEAHAFDAAQVRAIRMTELTQPRLGENS